MAINIDLFLQVWSLLVGIPTVLAVVFLYMMLSQGTVIHKTYPYKKSGETQSLLQEEGIKNANVVTLSTRNAAIGWACIISGGILQSKYAYIMVFTMLLYENVLDMIEHLAFEPRSIKVSVGYGILGLINFLALVCSIKL